MRKSRDGEATKNELADDQAGADDTTLSACSRNPKSNGISTRRARKTSTPGMGGPFMKYVWTLGLVLKTAHLERD